MLFSVVSVVTFLFSFFAFIVCMLECLYCFYWLFVDGIFFSSVGKKQTFICKLLINLMLWSTTVVVLQWLCVWSVSLRVHEYAQSRREHAAEGGRLLWSLIIQLHTCQSSEEWAGGSGWMGGKEECRGVEKSRSTLSSRGLKGEERFLRVFT